MARWEQLDKLATPTTRSVITLPSSLASSLLINTAGLERLMELGGIYSVRLSSERLAPLTNDPIASKVRYVLSETEVPVASLADWKALDVVFNQYVIDRHFGAQANQSDEAYAKLLNSLLKHAVVTAGWQMNMKEYLPSELLADISSIYILYILQTWLFLNKETIVLTEHFRALISAVIVSGIAWHIVDERVLTLLDGRNPNRTAVRFSLFRSINIDRAVALSLISKTIKLIKVQKK